MSSKQDEELQSRRISRRTAMFFGLQACGIAALGARARYLQIDQNERYLLLAEDNRFNTSLEIAPRGIIFDRFGRRVADNIPNFRIEADVERVQNAENIIRELARIVTLSPAEQEKLIKEIENADRYQIVKIAEQLRWEEFSLVNENLPVLPGIATKVALSRVYPYHEYLAHSVGYVGRPSQRDFDEMGNVHPIYRHPGAVIGKTGIEAEFETQLRGVEGKRVLEQNASGRIMREVEHEEGIPGAEIQLTLDAAFQLYAAKRMEGEAASAVVLDIETGDMRLLASSPSFDPNLFVFGISHADFDPLNTSIYRPMYNKAIQGTYAPGSTFKMVTALAALEAGVISPYDRVRCTGKINRGRDFNCWKRGGHGNMNLRDSLKQSCDVYYYTVAEKAGIERIADVARRLGLGQRYDIPNSSAGIVPDMAYKEERFGESWLVGDSFNAGIGQGYLLCTPLQLAVMTARIASGKAVLPNLVKSVDGNKQTASFEDLGFSPEHMESIRGGMFAVVNEDRGTARGSMIVGNGMQMAGKTGTAQVRNISAAERQTGVIRNEDLPWELRDNALFVAYAPADKPKYAISVVVEHGGGGSTAAAPIARDLLLYALYDGVPPLDAYPAGARQKAEQFIASVPSIESQRRGENGATESQSPEGGAPPDSATDNSGTA